VTLVQPGHQDTVRRLVDMALAAGGLVLSLPVASAAALAVKLTSPGPVLHRAVRVGQHGGTFVLYKFRTMVVDADRLGPAVTAGRDPRITTVGRLLRRSKIDELPQLVNVLRGDMSMVGPRPEDPSYVARYSPAQRALLQARPGITGPASLAFRHEQELLADVADPESYYVDVVMPAKADLDLAYLVRRTVASDLGVIFRTVLSVFRGTDTARAAAVLAGRDVPIASATGP
jgi:lipopolysaccharide/colanic/teichoic acid biosynthesis glycosyltransferase